MELEHITIQCTEKCFFRETLRPGNNIVIEERMTIVISNPTIKALIEML